MEILDNFFAFIAAYRFVIIFFTFLLVIIIALKDIFIWLIKEKIIFIWKKKQEEKYNKKQLKKEEKRKNKNRTVKANRRLFLRIIRYFRTIIFKGPPGAGKTSLMELFTRFILDEIERDDRRKYRYYKLMQPWKIKEMAWLKENKKLRVYTNLDHVKHPISGFEAMKDVQAVFEHRKKAITPCVLQMDEVSDLYGKEMAQEVLHVKDPEKKANFKGIKNSAKKPRHYNWWNLSTDQAGGDLVYIFRNVPHAIVEAIKTEYGIAKEGKRLQKWLIFKQRVLSGWFVSNYKKMYAETLFLSQKIKLFFKLFLPGYFCNEKQFYINRDEIYREISENYSVKKTLFRFEDTYAWVQYKRSESLDYDHLEFKNEYNNEFDKDGNRKAIGAV